MKIVGTDPRDSGGPQKKKSWREVKILGFFGFIKSTKKKKKNIKENYFSYLVV